MLKLGQRQLFGTPSLHRMATLTYRLGAVPRSASLTPVSNKRLLLSIFAHTAVVARLRWFPHYSFEHSLTCSHRDGAALDLSESLFQSFGGLGLGVFQMCTSLFVGNSYKRLMARVAWTEGGCGGGAPAPAAQDNK